MRLSLAQVLTMAKARTAYACTECGGQTSKWQGQCPHCSAWNTLVETIAAKPASRFQALAGTTSVVRSLASVETVANPRSPTGIDEFDRVLGGGLVAGGVILLGGDPGIGKSTLLLQATAAIGATRRCLYVTGEESVEQIALRAHRLGLVNAPVERSARCNPKWSSSTRFRRSTRRPWNPHPAASRRSASAPRS
jgi:DNA repair protein RadA/Sms